MIKFRLVFVLLTFLLGWSLPAATPIVLFDGKSADTLKLKGWELKDGILSGQGFLESKESLSSNFEMRLRFRFTEKFGKISFDKKSVIPFGFKNNRPTKKQQVKYAKQWYEVKILVRAMPEEKEMIHNLSPITTDNSPIAYYGSGPRLSDKYDSSKLVKEVGEDGFVPGIPS